MNAPELDERLNLPSASFSLRYKCLGAWNLIQACRKAGMIADSGSAAAHSGTQIHDALAGEDVELDQGQEEMKQTLQDIEYATVEALYPGLALYGREQRMWLRRGLKPLFSGKYDVAYADSKLQCAAIFDYKSGRQEIDPSASNSQMQDLAALWHYEHPETEQLDVVIIQPLVSHEPSIARYHYPDLDEALALLRQNLVDIADVDAARAPGYHCKWCPARAQCDESKNYSIQAPRVLLAAIERGDAVLPLGAKGKAVLESIEAGFAILTKLWTDYEHAVEANPDSIPGWHLEPGAEKRSITDYKKAREILAETLSEEELDECSSFKMTEAVKAFCNRAKMTQKRAKERFNEVLEPVLKWTTSKASLKPIAKRGRKALK